MRRVPWSRDGHTAGNPGRGADHGWVHSACFGGVRAQHVSLRGQWRKEWEHVCAAQPPSACSLSPVCVHAGSGRPWRFIGRRPPALNQREVAIVHTAPLRHRRLPVLVLVLLLPVWVHLAIARQRPTLMPVLAVVVVVDKELPHREYVSSLPLRKVLRVPHPRQRSSAKRGAFRFGGVPISRGISRIAPRSSFSACASPFPPFAGCISRTTSKRGCASGTMLRGQPAGKQHKNRHFRVMRVWRGGKRAQYRRRGSYLCGSLPEDEPGDGDD